MNPIQAFLCGWLAAAVGYDGRRGMKVQDIRQAVDDRGNYLPSFEVTFATGTVLRVRVEVVREPMPRPELTPDLTPTET